MIGLKKGTVRLEPHDPMWETEAAAAIKRLKDILGDTVKDAAHVGSTAVPSIMAKPIIDIALAVTDLEDVLPFVGILKDNGFHYRPNAIDSQILFACGSCYEGTGDLQTHFIHVVRENSMEWLNHVNFRDYLNSRPSVAREYEALKLSLAAQYPTDSGRERYLAGKHDFIVYTLRKALVRSYLGKSVFIKIDRPIGYVHKKEKYTLTYPINYGYVPGVLGGDSEELDVYLLGVQTPVEEYTPQIIGIAHRADDAEDKLIGAPRGISFTRAEIERAVAFQERYYQTTIELSDEPL